MLVLDTDILTIIQRASSVEYARLIARLPASDPLSVHVTIITVEEQLRGWLSYVAKAQTKETSASRPTVVCAASSAIFPPDRFSILMARPPTNLNS